MLARYGFPDDFLGVLLVQLPSSVRLRGLCKCGMGEKGSLGQAGVVFRVLHLVRRSGIGVALWQAHCVGFEYIAETA